MVGLGALNVIFAKHGSEVVDGVYLKTSWILSPVAVLAVVLDKPVTDVIGTLVHWLVPAQWTSGLSAPPILGIRSQVGAEWFAGAAALLLVGGCVVIAFAGRQDHEDAALRGTMLTRARLMATSWLLVVVAAQLGSLRELGAVIQATVRDWLPSGHSVLIAAGVVVMLMAVTVVTARRGSAGLELAGSVLWAFARVLGLLFGRFLGALVVSGPMVVIGFALWPATYIVKVCAWMLSATPESIQRAELKAASEATLPSGATVVQRSSGLQAPSPARPYSPPGIA